MATGIVPLPDQAPPSLCTHWFLIIQENSSCKYLTKTIYTLKASKVIKLNSKDAQQKLLLSKAMLLNDVSYMQCASAGSGKTLAFLLPVVASLHQQRHPHSSGLPSNTATDNAHADKPDKKKAQKGPKPSEPSSPAGAPRAVPKGPGAVVLAPSRELAAQTARCLVRLVKGLRLHCCLLTAAVAAGTDFTKVCDSTQRTEPCNDSLILY